MKIGLGVWDLTIRGGTQRQVIELAHGLRAAGHDVTLYCVTLNRAACFAKRLAGLPIVALRDDVDRVETASSHPSLPGRLAYYARRLGAQWEESRQLAARVDPATELFNAHDHNAAWLGALVKRRLSIPAVWMINDLPRGTFPRAHPVLAALGRAALGWNLNWFERRLVRTYDALVVLDERNRALARRAYGREATVIRSGLDVTGIAFRPRSAPAPDATTVLLCVGAIFPWRRYEDAIRATRLLRTRGRTVTLTITGRTDRATACAAALIRLASSLPHAPVTFAGDLHEAALRSAMASADIFLFPADRQTWGLTVFEAMAAGTPTVVSRGAGAHEVLVDRQTAMLVEPRRPEQIVAAVEALLDDPELYQRVSRQGRHFVETTLGWDRYAAAMDRLFRGLSGGAPSAPPR